MDLRDLMTLAGLVNPELLNKLQPTAEPECGCGSMEEEADGAGFDQATSRPEPEVMDDPMATMGSGVDNSLRRYLKAKGDHVTVDESDLYPDLTVENVTEAYAAFKEGKKPVDEDDVEEGNAYSGALAKAKAVKGESVTEAAYPPRFAFINNDEEIEIWNNIAKRHIRSIPMQNKQAAIRRLKQANYEASLDTFKGYQMWYMDTEHGVRFSDYDPELEEAAKPDFLDLDKDGNKKEPMKKAAKDKEEANESIDVLKALAGIK